MNLFIYVEVIQTPSEIFYYFIKILLNQCYKCNFGIKKIAGNLNLFIFLISQIGNKVFFVLFKNKFIQK